MPPASNNIFSNPDSRTLGGTTTLTFDSGDSGPTVGKAQKTAAKKKKNGGQTTPTVAAGSRTTPAATFTRQPKNVVGTNAGFNSGQPSNL